MVVFIGLMLAALWAVIWFTYRRDMERAFRHSAAGSRMAETRCGPIEYIVAGSGPPVLAVHGAGGGCDQGMELAQDLPARGFGVVAMSRFGYLRTPLPSDASPSAQADAHACLLDFLGLSRVAVIGASAGAPSAMQFALRYPERTAALVLLVPAAWAPRTADSAPLHAPPGGRVAVDLMLRSEFLFWAARRLMPGLMMRAVLATPPERVASAGPGERMRVRQFLEHIAPVRARRAGLLNEMAVVAALPRYDLERITAPTLVICADDDMYGTLAAARYTAGHIPQARLVRYAEGGHLLAGHGREVEAEIAAFIHAAGQGQGAAERGLTNE